MRFVGASFFVAFLLAACTKNSTIQKPAGVDAQAVKSILMTSSSQSQVCAKEVHRSGAQVLYANNAGVLMTDAPSSSLALKNCQAEILPNEVHFRGKSSTKAKLAKNLDQVLALLPAEEMGARSFVKANPDFDGQKVLIAVLDTGLELAHPLLSKTTRGEDKIIAFEDFSGEGKIKLEAVNSEEADVFTAPDGHEYSAQGIGATGYHFGIFEGSTLNKDNLNDEIPDMAVLTYKKNGSLWGRVDTDNDKDFSNEKELTDYSDSREFILLGKKKSLSAAFNVHDDGKSATLCFDDGGHGTHVAGIAAGYTANGLQGVAPGAQIIGAKIGDSRLVGGSTTTASKMLAIDYAVAQGADVINISYGIRAGSNTGKSAIDKYVDKIALENDVLFSISAGNEGPGIQTIGTPAGADLAITPGAYVSKDTAHNSYGYIGVEKNNMWYFSSVGPRSDGGWKPTIAAPGSAVSSLPIWAGGSENYRGTSMAAPQVTGGIALLLSGAKQSDLPTERALVTQAVYSGAKPIADLKWIQQGHGLMNVPASFAKLKELKGELPIDYDISINSPTTPTGRGAGIFVRSKQFPANAFTVRVHAKLPKNLSPAEVASFLRTYDLKPSASWINLPKSFWTNSSPHAFMVKLDSSELTKPGLYSEKITAVDHTNGQVAFEIPVTLVRPHVLDFSNDHTFEMDTEVEVGDTKRFFIDIPAGTTSVQIDLVSDGPRVWGQLLEGEGRKVVDIDDRDRAEPQPPVFAQTNIARGGVYELDLTAPAYNQETAKVKVKLTAYSLSISKTPPTGDDEFILEVQNNFAPVKLRALSEMKHVQKKHLLRIEGDKKDVDFEWTKHDAKDFLNLSLKVKTAKHFYDLMTDFPYRIFCENGKQLVAGVLEMDSEINLSSPCEGKNTLKLQGAFTHSAPKPWFVSMTEQRHLIKPVEVSSSRRTLIESGQVAQYVISTASVKDPVTKDLENCLSISLEASPNRLVQQVEHCF